VIVETRSEREQNRVRSLVPEAFRTYLNGQAVMQAGVFSDRDNAEELLEMLQSNGFKATVQELQ
jgi:cell division septation protein DedD